MAGPMKRDVGFASVTPAIPVAPVAEAPFTQQEFTELTKKATTGQLSEPEKQRYKKYLDKSLGLDKKGPAAVEEIKKVKVPEEIKKVEKPLPAAEVVKNVDQQIQTANELTAKPPLPGEPTLSAARTGAGGKPEIDADALAEKDLEQRATDYGEQIRKKALAEGKSEAIANTMALEAYKAFKDSKGRVAETLPGEEEELERHQRRPASFTAPSDREIGEKEGFLAPVATVPTKQEADDKLKQETPAEQQQKGGEAAKKVTEVIIDTPAGQEKDWKAVLKAIGPYLLEAMQEGIYGYTGNAQKTAFDRRLEAELQDKLAKDEYDYWYKKFQNTASLERELAKYKGSGVTLDENGNPMPDLTELGADVGQM